MRACDIEPGRADACGRAGYLPDQVIVISTTLRGVSDVDEHGERGHAADSL